MSSPYSVHLRKTLRLAVPASLAQLGMMLMGVVDTAMVGRLGAAPLAAVALGSSLYFAFAVAAMGLLSALDPMVSQAYGAGDRRECGAVLQVGVRLAIWLALPLALCTIGVSALLGPLGVSSAVAQGAAGYMRVLAFGAPLLLVFWVERAFLQGLGRTRPALVAAVVANIANIALNWVLIYGNLGFPALGELGCAISTVVCRSSMALVLMWLIYGRSAGLDEFSVRRMQSGAAAWRPDWSRLRKIWRVGAPISGHMVSEVGMFSAVALMMGWLGPNEMAAHQIALQLAACTFMLTMGLGIAGGIRVGHASGAGERSEASRAAWVAVYGAALMMFGAAVMFVLIPERLASLFTSDPVVRDGAAALLRIAAWFQLADGVQGVAAGCLRGAGDTAYPMRVHVVTSFVVGLPLAIFLAFGMGLGAAGLWWGLTAGLCCAGAMLVWRLYSGRWWSPLARTT